MLDKETRGIIASGDPHDLARNNEHPWVRRFFNRQAGDGQIAAEENESGRATPESKESS